MRNRNGVKYKKGQSRKGGTTYTVTGSGGGILSGSGGTGSNGH